MKIHSISCPVCGGIISEDIVGKKEINCPFCGQKIIIEDEKASMETVKNGDTRKSDATIIKLLIFIIAFLFILFVAVFMIISMISYSNRVRNSTRNTTNSQTTGSTVTSQKINGSSSGQGTTTGSNASSTAQPAINDKDFTTKEYILDDEGGNSYCFLIVTNHGEASAMVKGNAVAKDAQGGVIGAADMTISMVGPGETQIGFFYFRNVTGIDHVECTLSYGNSMISKSPILDSLSVEQSQNKQNVIVSVTNYGEVAAEFVQGYALFFDKNNRLIHYDRTYFGDNDSEIKQGKTITKQLDCRLDYDHVELYFTGSANVKNDGTCLSYDNINEVDFLDTKEYSYDDGYSKHYFTIITNNSEEDYRVGLTAVTENASGKLTGAVDETITVLGAGDTAVGHFVFTEAAEVAKVNYGISLSEPQNNSAGKGLVTEISENEQNVVIAVTNKETEAANYVEVYTFMFDASNKVVGYDWSFVGDDDYQVKPGATLYQQVNVRKPYDHVEVYLKYVREKNE